MIHGFDAGLDRFDLPVSVGSSPSTVDHTVSVATFDTDMGNAISDSVVKIVHADAGDLIGHYFLFVDGLGGGGGYQPGQDYIIDITGYSGTLTNANFI